MSLLPIDPASANAQVRALFDRMREDKGMVPALQRVLAHSSTVLKGYLAFQEQLDDGGLDRRLRYQIALAVSQVNESEYCLAAYSALGRAAGLSDQALRDARMASSPDRRWDTVLKFARALENDVAGAARDQLWRMRDVGFNDSDIVEVLAQVSVVAMLNCLYHLSAVTVDFPSVDLTEIERNAGGRTGDPNSDNQIDTYD